MLVTEKIFGFLLAALEVHLMLDGLDSLGLIHLANHQGRAPPGRLGGDRGAGFRSVPYMPGDPHGSIGSTLSASKWIRSRWPASSLLPSGVLEVDRLND